MSKLECIKDFNAKFYDCSFHELNASEIVDDVRTIAYIVCNDMKLMQILEEYDHHFKNVGFFIID